MSLEQRCPSVRRSAWAQRKSVSSVFHLSLSISLLCLCVPTAFTVSCIQLPWKAFASLSNLKSHNIKRLLRHKTNPRRFQLKVLGKFRGARRGGQGSSPFPLFGPGCSRRRSTVREDSGTDFRASKVHYG